MNYHTPHPLWAELGYPDFESYEKHLVLKGKFHPCVHKDVIDAFTIAEYQMAHAYYHYPMYDEGFSKLLRIIEMAVKLRCQELGISLDSSIINNITNIAKKKNLNALMKALELAESAKNLSVEFKLARDLRNMVMHPERHSYGGTIFLDYIRRAIILLNKIFIPESTLVSLSKELENLKKKIQGYRNDLFILNHGELKYLITSADIVSAAFIKQEWLYLIACNPVIKNIGESLANHSYHLPLVFYISDLNFLENYLECNILKDSKKLRIYKNDNENNKLTYRTYLKEIEEATETNRFMYEHNCSYEISKRENIFWYEALWRV